MDTTIKSEKISEIRGFPTSENTRARLWIVEGAYASIHTIWLSREQVAAMRKALDALYPEERESGPAWPDESTDHYADEHASELEGAQ